MGYVLLIYGIQAFKGSNETQSKVINKINTEENNRLGGGIINFSRFPTYHEGEVRVQNVKIGCF